MKYRSILLLLILSMSQVIYAQDRADYDIYMSHAEDCSILFRGKRATNYSFIHNGTYYWESPEYKVGDIVYYGRRYYDITMNVDAFSQQVIVATRKSSIKMNLNTDYVEEFNLGETRFENLPFKGYNVPKGFYQVLYKGDAVLYKRVVRMYSDNGTSNRGANYTNDGMHAIVKEFSPVITYYLLQNGVISEIKGRNALLRKYDKETRKHTRKFIRKRNLDLDSDFEIFCTRVLNYIETGNEK